LTLEERLAAALKTAQTKPAADAEQAMKRGYSQSMSSVFATELGAYLRDRGCADARPAAPGELGGSGAERRMAGGIGAKKVDVTWATAEAGLIFAASIKTINAKDARSGNYQKNLTNRRADLLFESVTLHRRFPYAVMLGLFCLDQGAAADEKMRGEKLTRRSTFQNAHQRLQLFTGRDDPADREEQFEILCILLVDSECDPPKVTAYEAGEHNALLSLDDVIDRSLLKVGERNPDFYEYDVASRMIKKLSR
jgi:hypothetical protein